MSLFVIVSSRDSLTTQKEELFTKKLLRWTLITLAIVITASVLTHCLFFLQFSHTRTWAHAADYDGYADDFHVVKDYIQAQFPGEYGKWIYVSPNGGTQLYDPDTDEYLQLPSYVLSSLESIRKNGFPHKDGQLDVIRIDGDRISFCTTKGQYALVYSPSQKPSWVNSPDDTAMTRIKSIGDGWYHVAKTSG